MAAIKRRTREVETGGGDESTVAEWRLIKCAACDGTGRHARMDGGEDCPLCEGEGRTRIKAAGGTKGRATG